MKPLLYLSLEEVLELHKVLIDRFGGQQGVRDLGLLESALIRPQTGYYESLSEQAAALMQSLVQNHAFIDGNKRVAVAAADIFLRLNGYRLSVSAQEGEKFIIDRLIVEKISLAEITKWIESRMSKVSL